jgi:uncharacterized repeat protein (TIGR01451 family)
MQHAKPRLATSNRMQAGHMQRRMPFICGVVLALFLVATTNANPYLLSVGLKNLIGSNIGGFESPIIAGGLVADLSITKTDGVTTAIPGGSVTYTITASNAGPSNASSVTVADTFPASLTATWTCVGAGGGTCTASGSGNINDTVNLPTGGSVTYTAVATISASAVGILSNTATVSASSVSDPNPGNNSATDTDTLAPQADLSITKTDGVTTAAPGGSVTYTITASNAGPSNTSSVTVADTFPASLTATWTCVGAGGGICTASGSGNINNTVILPAGGSVTYTAVATISSSAIGMLSNTATVSASSTTDPNPGNNAATDIDTLIPPVAVSINQAIGQNDPSTTSPINFTVVFTAPVSGFATGDVTLGGTAGATTGTVTEIAPNDGTTYNVAVGGMTSDGTVIATIAAGVASGSSNAQNAASTSSDNSVSFAPPAPVVTAIVRNGANPTNASSVQYSISFSGSVLNVDTSDFSLVASGVSGASVTNVSGSNSTRIVTVSTGTGNGTLGLNLIDDGTITDSSNRQLGGAGTGNGNFAGESFTIDKTAPTAGNLVVPPAEYRSASYRFTITFSDNLAIDLNSLDGTDIRVTGPAGYNQLATFISASPASIGSPRTATYQITPPGGSWDISDNGLYSISLEANQITDTAGNQVSAMILGSFSVNIHLLYMPLILAKTPE